MKNEPNLDYFSIFGCIKTFCNGISHHSTNVDVETTSGGESFRGDVIRLFCVIDNVALIAVERTMFLFVLLDCLLYSLANEIHDLFLHCTWRIGEKTGRIEKLVLLNTSRIKIRKES